MELSQKMNLQFCENCKLHYFPDVENNSIPDECRFCRGDLIDTGVSYEEYRDMPKAKRCSKCKRKYPKLFIKCPKCNNQLTKLSTENKKMDRQINTIREQTQEFYNKQQNLPKCPTCGSTNIRRISTAEKATSTIMFGIFSNKRKYQFECQNPKCKYKW